MQTDSLQIPVTLRNDVGFLPPELVSGLIIETAKISSCEIKTLE